MTAQEGRADLLREWSSAPVFEAGGAGSALSEQFFVFRRRRAVGQRLAWAGVDFDVLNSPDFGEGVESDAAFRLMSEDAGRISEWWRGLNLEARIAVDAGVMVAAGTVAVSASIYGEKFPDFDIKYLGIGMHRFWLLHSAVAAWVCKDFLEAVKLLDAGDTNHPVVTKLCAAAVAGGAVGIGIHLVRDGLFGWIEGEKSVTFGLPGIWTRSTLVRGTYLDDDLWLLGNSAWAFKIAKDVVVLAYADDIDHAREWVARTFGPLAAHAVRVG